jgi:hypothetical protein
LPSCLNNKRAFFIEGVVYLLSNTEKLYFLKSYKTSRYWFEVPGGNFSNVSGSAKIIYETLSDKVEKEIRERFDNLSSEEIDEILMKGKNLINGTLQALLNSKISDTNSTTQGESFIKSMRQLRRAGLTSSSYKMGVEASFKESALLSNLIAENYFNKSNFNEIIESIQKDSKGNPRETEQDQAGAARGHLSNLQSIITETLVTNVLNYVDSSIENPGIVGLKNVGGDVVGGKRSKSDSDVYFKMNGVDAIIGISIKAYLGKSATTFKAVEGLSLEGMVVNYAKKSIDFLTTRILTNKSWTQTIQDRKLLAAILADEAIGGFGNRALIATKFTARKGDAGIDVETEFLSNYFKACADRIGTSASVPNITKLKIENENAYNNATSLSSRLAELRVTIFAPIKMKQGG